ncbi:glycosyltransferase [Methylomonas sp. YC3]
MIASIELITGGTRGLTNDAKIVKTTLGEKFEVNVNVSRERNLHSLHKRFLIACNLLTPASDRLFIYFQILPTAWLKLSENNIFIPNQEFVREETIANLEKCHQIWCKTKYAHKIFQNRGLDSRYIGFSSEDMYLPQIEKDFRKFIHVAGRSHLKGTRMLLELWVKNPNWPMLNIITSQSYFKDNFKADNINYLSDLPDTALRQLMNKCGIHLCPSETEGFGHYINEAMSTKALIITVDAPPMNELVPPGQGLLAKYSREEIMSLSQRFFVDKNDLQSQIIAAIDMNQEEKAGIGELARQSFLARKVEFSMLLNLQVNDFLQKKVG